MMLALRIEGDYTKYRTYVRIPMEQLQYWWTVGGFEFKEHIIAMGIALLPAYWYFWRQPLSQEHATIRKWVTVFIAVAVISSSFLLARKHSRANSLASLLRSVAFVLQVGEVFGGQLYNSGR
jgi:hypothetical protein